MKPRPTELWANLEMIKYIENSKLYKINCKYTLKYVHDPYQMMNMFKKLLTFPGKVLFPFSSFSIRTEA